MSLPDPGNLLPPPRAAARTPQSFHAHVPSLTRLPQLRTSTGFSVRPILGSPTGPVCPGPGGAPDVGFPVLKAGESQAKWDEWVTAVSRKIKRQSTYRDWQSSWPIIRDHRRQARTSPSPSPAPARSGFLGRSLHTVGAQSRLMRQIGRDMAAGDGREGERQGSRDVAGGGFSADGEKEGTLTGLTPKIQPSTPPDFKAQRPPQHPNPILPSHLSHFLDRPCGSRSGLCSTFRQDFPHRAQSDFLR